MQIEVEISTQHNILLYTVVCVCVLKSNQIELTFNNKKYKLSECEMGVSITFSHLMMGVEQKVISQKKSFRFFLSAFDFCAPYCVLNIKCALVVWVHVHVVWIHVHSWVFFFVIFFCLKGSCTLT